MGVSVRPCAPTRTVTLRAQYTVIYIKSYYGRVCSPLRSYTYSHPARAIIGASVSEPPLRSCRLNGRAVTIYIDIKIIGRAGASPPSRTAAIIFLYIYLFIYIYPCRTSCPKSSTCFFFSDISIFLRRKCMLHAFLFLRYFNIS